MNSTRVLLVQRIYPAYRRALFEQLSNVDDLDVTFAFGSSTADGTIKSCAAPANANYIELENRYWRHSEQMCWQQGLLSHVNTTHFDVVIAEFNPRIISNVVMALNSRLQKLPVIWWGHGINPHKRAPAVLNTRLVMIRLANAVILYDELTRKQLIAGGIAPEKLFVANNAIDTTTIRKLRFMHGNAHKFRITYVGRIIPQKKLDLLIRAFALARARLPDDLVLTIIGEGPAKSSLQSLAQQLEIADRVSFPGEEYEEDKLARYYAESLFSVSAGYVGLMAIQSLAFGVPLIIPEGEHHRPEIAYLQNRRHFRYFQADNWESLSELLVELANDVEQRESMVENGLELINHYYSIESMVEVFSSAIRFATGKL